MMFKMGSSALKETGVARMEVGTANLPCGGEQQVL